MNRGIYATAAGMIATQRWMDTTAHNIANVSTNGFKRDGLAFREQMEQQMFLGGRHLGSMGRGPVVHSAFTNFEPGPIHHTGVDLDVAVDGERGAFALRSPEGGVSYTRDGAFRIDGSGRLVHRNGHAVLDHELRPISIPAGRPVIEPDGLVRVDGQQVARLGVFHGTFRKSGAGFEADDARPVAEPRLTPRALEGSNVNAIQSMTDMVKIGRLMEISQKSIQAQDELTQRLIQSLQDR
jgi:flagellar basal-body rod protein FlgF